MAKKKAEKPAEKPERDEAEEASEKSRDDLMSPAKSEGKGKIAILRRTFKEGAEKGIGFQRTVWSEIWEKRKTYNLRLKNGQSTSGVLLNDPVPMLFHRFVYGWKSGEKGGFAQRDFVRCAGLKVDDEGHLKDTGKKCLACQFFGNQPMIVLMLAIGDVRKQYDSEGNEIPWSVKHIILYNNTVRDGIFKAIEMASVREKRNESFAGAVFDISRSGNKQSVSYGDVWVFDRFVDTEGKTLKKMLAKVPNWHEQWVIPTDDQIRAMAQIHMRVGTEHQLDDNDMWDVDGAVEVLGEKAVTKPKSGGKETDEDDLLEPSKSKKKGPKLTEMDDIEDAKGKKGKDEEEEDEDEEEEEEEEEEEGEDEEEEEKVAKSKKKDKKKEEDDDDLPFPEEDL